MSQDKRIIDRYLKNILLFRYDISKHLSVEEYRICLKKNLSVHGCVEKRFKMLRYYVYALLFHHFVLRFSGFRRAQLVIPEP